MKNKRIIEIEVNDEYIVGSGVVIGAAGSHNDVVMKVRFNSSWAGLNIIATFRDALGENPISVVLTAVSTLVEDESDGDHCVHKFSVPLKAKAYEGKISLSFTGYTVAAVASEDGEGVEYQETQAITSGTAYFNVLKSDAVLADDIFKTADAGQQLHADVETLGDMYGNLYDALAAIKDIQGSLGSTTLTVADLGSLEEAIRGVKEFVEYEERDNTEDKNNVFLRVYPVGSIYMSLDDTNPAMLFGGTWEQIKDKFLLSAGDTYESGTSGGSASHTHGLTKAYAKAYLGALPGKDGKYGLAMSPVYSNVSYVINGGRFYVTDANPYSYNDPNPVTTGTGLGGNTDSSTNIPPYLTVYMWKRIA